MIPGEYSVCRIAFDKDADAAIYTTIQYGFDTPEQAFDAIPGIARDENIPEDELVVIRFVERKKRLNNPLPESGVESTRFSPLHHHVLRRQLPPRGLQ